MVKLMECESSMDTVLLTSQEPSVSPLSPGQYALWFLQRLNPTSAAYHVARAMRFPGPLDVQAFRRSMQVLFARHPILRTSFRLRNGEPVQWLDERTEPPHFEIDASGWSEAELTERIGEEVARPFDMEAGPLYRTVLISRSPEEHIALYVFHHTVIDLWSLAILLFELDAIYEAERTGKPLKLPAPTEPYSTFVGEQMKMLAGPEGERLWAYWKEQLAGDLPPLELPTDRPRPPVRGFRAACVTRRLGPELSDRLKVLARAQSVLLNELLLTAYQVLLHRYSGQDDFLVGIPYAGRTRRFISTVGYFVNPLPIRADLREDPAFTALLQQVSGSVRSANQHGDYPFVRMAEQLQTERDPSRPPLFQVAFAWQKTIRLVDREAFGPFILHERGGSIKVGELRAESYPIEHQVSTVDMTLLGAEVGAEIALSLEYSTDLFDRSTVERMMEHLCTLLEGVTLEPDTAVSWLPLLTPEEHVRVVGEWNATEAPFPSNRCLHELVAEQTARTPGAVAMVFGEQRLTYAEVERRSNQVAHALREQGVGPDVRVGIYLERSPEAVIALLGVLKAGGAYVPLDPMYPAERLRYMLQDAQPAVLVTTEPLLAGLGEAPYPTLCVDRDAVRLDAEPTETPVSGVTPDNLAYVIYTSGSTGRPKGVMVEHRGVVNLVTNQIRGFGIHAESRLLQFASLSFDASVSEVFTALAAGARLHLAPRDKLRDVHALEEVLRTEGITVVTLPPSILAVLPHENLPGLTTIVSAGEALSWAVARRWSTGRRLLNAYGPTEATIGPTLHSVEDAAPSAAATVPIGRPLANVRCYVLDAHQRPVAVGLAGELYIGGVQVARGYLNRPEAVAEKFLADPFREGERLYRTGDRVRWLPDGTLEFLGRVDEQVKLRGFRIEPGEIAAALCEHPAVEEAAVALRTDGPAPRLVAYVVPRSMDRLELWPSGTLPAADDPTVLDLAAVGARETIYAPAIRQAAPGQAVLVAGSDPEATLAQMCVQAGARHVYVVEAQKEVCRRARAAVARLGLEDRITVLQDSVTRVQLSEPVGVVVAEVVETLEGIESAAARLGAARTGLLQDGGVVIPARSALRIAGVSLPEDFLREPGFAPQAATHVEPLFAAAGQRFDLRVALKGVEEENLVTRPGVVAEADFREVDTPLPHGHSVELTVTRAGRLDGFLLWPTLGEADAADADGLPRHGAPVLLPVFDDGAEVQAGDTVAIEIEAVVSGAEPHPDYLLRGEIRRAGATLQRFEYRSYGPGGAYRTNRFYQALFREEEIPVRPVGGAPSSLELREHLRQRLPDFMVPSAFVALAALPLSPNGKVDRSALPAPALTRTDSGANAQPRNQVERTIAEIWREALQLETIGIHDNFFDLGGHSLLAVHVHGRIQEQLGREFPMLELFRHPTISTLAEALSEGQDTEAAIEEIRTRAQRQKEAMQRQQQLRASMQQRRMPR
jgi:amino acid adenylation domain-containing protein